MLLRLMGACSFKDCTFWFELCNPSQVSRRVFLEPEARLTFFSRMPRLLWTSCAMREREGKYAQLAE